VEENPTNSSMTRRRGNCYEFARLIGIALLLLSLVLLSLRRTTTDERVASSSSSGGGGRLGTGVVDAFQVTFRSFSSRNGLPTGGRRHGRRATVAGNSSSNSNNDDGGAATDSRVLRKGWTTTTSSPSMSSVQGQHRGADGGGVALLRCRRRQQPCTTRTGRCSTGAPLSHVSGRFSYGRIRTQRYCHHRRHRGRRSYRRGYYGGGGAQGGRGGSFIGEARDPPRTFLQMVRAAAGEEGQTQETDEDADPEPLSALRRQTQLKPIPKIVPSPRIRGSEGTAAPQQQFPQLPLTGDPDRIRRRQLLLSMLATANVSPLLFKTLAARAVETATATADEQLLDASTFASANVHVIKPPMDDREYLAYTLDNGIRVLLCSDPSSNEAGAAMDVHVGAFSDPDEVPGLAHFNEHMLFLGTKKYKQEDSFEAFLASNGGSSNAYTDSENTVYYFDLEAEADTKFAEGLSRFGSFFTAPLFTASATGRELNAIDSENAKNLQSDTFRFFQLTKARANLGHPFHKFSTGNKQTLLDDTKARGINLRDELIRFYDRYYSANQMTLAVIGPEPIDKLQKMVADGFGQVKNKHVSKPEDAWTGIVPFGGSEDSVIPAFNHILEIVPVQDLRQVTMSWPIVYRSDQDRTDSLLVKPSNYLGHLLGHEGPRSLVSYLKSKGWANSIAAGAQESLSDFETFELVVSLTTAGLVALDDIIEAVFSYISMLRDRTVPSYIFEEVLQLDELQWRFVTKSSVGGYVQSLAASMQKFPPALYIAGPRRLALDEYAASDSATAPALSDSPRSGFSSKAQLDRTRLDAVKLANALTVDNAMISVISKSFEGQTDRKEKWYGTDYRVRRISEAILDKWRRPVAPMKLSIDFPNPNPFIPSESGLRLKIPPADVNREEKRSFESRMVPLPPPVVIRDDGPDGRWTVYFKQDDRFGQPKGFVIFELLSREVYASPLQAALGTMYELTVSDRLREYTYDAELAGLTYDVRVLPRGVRLTFGGYNDKLKEFASYVCKKLSREVSDVLPKTDNDFERYKDLIMRGLSAFDVKQPYAHASYYAQLALQPHRFQYTNQDLRDATRKITLPDLVDYVKGLWSSGKGEALVQGNFDQGEALDLINTIGASIQFRPIPESLYPPRLEALPLPPTSREILPTRILLAEPNGSNENSVSYAMLQSLGKTEKDHVLIELLSAIVQEPFYNELRTKKQLGYIVSSGIRGIGDTRTLSFVVQSSVATADELTLEILNFLETVEDKILSKVSKADVAVYVKSLLDRKTEPDKELTTEVTRNWSEIASGRLQFDRIQKEAAALLDVSKQDLLDFWKKLYSGDGRRALISQVIPKRGPASSTAPPTTTGYTSDDVNTEGLVLGIDDLEQFRRDREKIVSN